MKKRIEKYKILILILAVILSLVLLTLTLKNRKLTFPEKVIKDSVLLVENFFYKPISFFQSNFSKEEDQTMKLLIEEQKKTIEELKQLTEIEYTLESYEEVNATVIKRNIDDFYETITIDKGEKDGISEKMAVVTKGSLIGIISTTSYRTSTVKLLTSSFPLSVKIRTAGQELYGIIKQYKENAYIVEGISENTEIEIESEVVTTGYGYPIPSGILVGTVTKEEKDHFDLNRTVYVKPSISMDNLHYVKVLKRK